MDLSCETNIHIMSSFVDYFCCLCLMFVFVVLFCLFLVALERADLLALMCLCFLVFVSPSHMCLDLHQN